ncbi:MAG TPA: hypothetical protein VKR06_46835 [Ktedonosporobacter sp.]|nr:hypothetical protein [Ktedonosporobacter sp.]
MIVLSLTAGGDFYFNLSFVLIAVFLNLAAAAAMIADQKQVPRYSVEKTQRVYEKLVSWKYVWQRDLVWLGLFVAVFVLGGRQFGALYSGELILAAGALLFYGLLVIERYRKQQLVRKRAEELGLRPPLQ